MLSNKELAVAAACLYHAFWAAMACNDADLNKKYENLPEEQKAGLSERLATLKADAGRPDPKIEVNLSEALLGLDCHDELFKSAITYADDFVGIFNGVSRRDDTPSFTALSARRHATRQGFTLPEHLEAGFQSVGANNLANACRELGL
jgi:hypothetical protein